MKIYLCGKGHCPALDLGSKYIKIGEKGNMCILAKKEWTALKRKIISREV